METTPFINPLLTRINFMSRPNISCDYHRIELPCIHMGVEVNDNSAETDLNVFCRIPPEQIKNGKPYIVDVDDYWYLYPEHYLYANWQSFHTGQLIVEAMKGAEAVIVPNMALYDKARQYNKRVFLIPNALPFDYGQFTRMPISGPAKFFWAGGSSHLNDLKILREVLKLAYADLTLMGDDGGHQWRGIKAIFGQHAKIKPVSPVGSYMSAYEGNVMLIPLENNYFNIHKSNLKILEAGAKGMAVIASRTAPYLNSLDEPYVMYADTPQEWARHVLYCKANPSFVHEMGMALAEHVRRYYQLGDACHQREEVFQDVLTRL